MPYTESRTATREKETRGGVKEDNVGSVDVQPGGWWGSRFRILPQHRHDWTSPSLLLSLHLY